jgi:polyhydroxybutyrate depolymerase
VLFTSDLLNTLQRELCVDARRIYAAGKSNGGAAWANRNGCFPRPLEYSPKTDVVVQHWAGCSLQHYRVEGAGHVWPSTKPNNDSATPTVIDATPIIWRFFLAHHSR